MLLEVPLFWGAVRLSFIFCFQLRRDNIAGVLLNKQLVAPAVGNVMPLTLAR